MPFLIRSNFLLLKLVIIASVCALLFALPARAENFTNALAAAALAEKHGDLPAALILYGNAEKLSSNNVVNLCTLSRCYCELTYLTNSLPIQKTLLEQALACALQAIKADPRQAVTGRLKTGHSEVRDSYHFCFLDQAIFASS